MPLPTSRLVAALALSLALHGGLLFADLRQRAPAPPPRPALQALLRLPPKIERIESPPAEILLKNTLAEAIDEKPIPEPTPPAPEKSPQKPKTSAKPAPTPATKLAAKPSPKREIEAAQRKLAEHQFYPRAAIDQGLEGEVRLIIMLDADGLVSDVSLAASSGHALLDNAAIRAAYAMGRLTGANSRELILPVIFRLQ